MNAKEHKAYNSTLCLIRFAVGQMRILYVFFDKIRLDVGKSNRGSNAGGRKNISGETPEATTQSVFNAQNMDSKTTPNVIVKLLSLKGKIGQMFGVLKTTTYV